jgi:hypothetical protein
LNDRASTWILAALITALSSLPARAAEDAALLKDLTSVIALLGLPCGQVVSAKRLNDNDHVATCRDGNRYRVFINSEGKVVAQRL